MNLIGEMIEVEEPLEVEELVALTRGEAPTVHDPTKTARGLMLRLREAEAEKEQVAALKGRLVETYDAKIERLERRIGEARAGLDACVRIVGDKIAHPDLGTAYLANVKGKVKVTDPEAFKEWAIEEGYSKVVVDETAAKAHLLETGQIVEGMEFEPAHRALRFKEANA